MDFQTILNNVGDTISDYVSKGIDFLTEQTPAKIIAIIILLVLSYFSLKIAQPIIKWAAIILTIFLVISTGYSLVN